MLKRHGANNTLERLLFHGTDEDTLPQIMAQGFDRSFCGKNATVHGKGVYFAVESEYSARDPYSKPNSAGEKFMFVCRVLVGEYCKGRQDARAPDYLEGFKRYDTTVDSMQTPKIFVTYNDAQAYPEYLVKFKLK